MATTTGDNLGIAIAQTPGTTPWWADHEAGQALLDAVVFLDVIERDLDTPPGVPGNGDRYHVGASPSGAWASNAGDIAVRRASAWVFYTPKEGWLMTCQADPGQVFKYESGAFVAIGSSITSFKEPVRVATTTAGTLASDYESGDTIDGVTLATGDRILIKDQATGSQNGIYTVSVSGAPIRALDFDESTEALSGCIIPVQEGTANGDKLFMLTTNAPITIGSTSLTFAAYGTGSTAIWSGLTDPAGNLSLAMAAYLTTLTWAGNYSTSSAFKLVGNNTSATGPLLHLTTNTSNLIPPLLVEIRGSNPRLKVGHLGDVLVGQAAMGATDTDGFPYIPTIGSNSFPTSTPTGQTGLTPVVAYSNGINTEYDLAAYLGGAWRSIGGARKRYDTSTGTGAQTIDFNSCAGDVARKFTFGAGTATFTFSNPPPAGTLITLIIVQDGTGGRTATWPGTVVWAGGSAPTLSTAANAVDTFQFIWDGTNYRETRPARYTTTNFLIDGGGSAITTGIKGDIQIDQPGTIVSATLLADQSGSIVVDIWKDTYANFPPTGADTITASAKPTISSATKSQDTTLTGWTTSIAAGDILRINVDSITTITRCTLALKIKLL